MGAAKFIVESLHSLSVDITRGVYEGVDEKTWKLYQNGNVGAFTRSLVKEKDALPMEQLCEKYKTDGEFRSYVNRFTHQYEEMMDQASGVDHADLLSTTFLNSDIGKLYEIVCDIAGRLPVTALKASKAA